MFGIPRVSFAGKTSSWATNEAPIESQTPTESTEIAFAQNELVAPEKKPNEKIEKQKKCRDAFLRSSQVRKLLFEKPSHRVILSFVCCSTSSPGGDQVDGLPPASSYSS